MAVSGHCGQHPAALRTWFKVLACVGSCGEMNVKGWGGMGVVGMGVVGVGWMVQSAPMGSSLNDPRQLRAGAHNIHKGKKKRFY